MNKILVFFASIFVGYQIAHFLRTAKWYREKAETLVPTEDPLENTPAPPTPTPNVVHDSCPRNVMRQIEYYTVTIDPYTGEPIGWQDSVLNLSEKEMHTMNVLLGEPLFYRIKEVPSA